MSRHRTRVLSLLNHYQTFDSQQLTSQKQPRSVVRDKFNKFFQLKRGKTDDFKQYLNKDDKKSKSLSISRTISRNSIINERHDLMVNEASPASTHSSSSFHPLLPKKNKPSQFVVNLIKRSYVNNNRRIKIVIGKNNINKLDEDEPLTPMNEEKLEKKEAIKCQSSNLLAATSSCSFNFSLLKKLNHEKKKSFYNDAINTIYNELIRQKSEAIQKMQREEMPDQLGINKIIVKKRIAIDRQKMIKDAQNKKLQRTKTCDKDVRCFIGNKCANPEFKNGIKGNPTVSILKKIQKRKQNTMEKSKVTTLKDSRFFNDEVVERVCPWDIGSSRNNDQF